MDKRSFSQLTVLLLSLTVVHCTKDTVMIDEETKTPIPMTGGTARSAAGELTLAISADTFDGPTTVVIRTDRTPNKPKAIGPIFELSTEPHRDRFNSNISITIRNDSNETKVAIANFDGANPQIAGGAQYDAATKVASASLEHFSSYALIRTTTTSTPTPGACPSVEPGVNSACTEMTEICYYGQECCCGNCHPSMGCICNGTTWGCFATDACFGASLMCPDGGMGPDTGTTTSTRTCSQIESEYAYLTSDAFRACVNDSDCHLVDGHCGVALGGCIYTLSTTVSQSQLDLLAAEFTGQACNLGRPVCQCAPPPSGAICEDNECVPAP